MIQLKYEQSKRMSSSYLLRTVFSAKLTPQLRTGPIACESNAIGIKRRFQTRSETYVANVP